MDEGNFLGLLLGALGAVSVLMHRRREILGPWRLGHAHLAGSKYAEAEACFRRTLDIAERRFGAEHWRTAIHVNALAQALLAQRRFPEAKALVARALGIVERWKPMPHPQLSVVYVGAAALARDQGELDRARELLARARMEARGDAEVLAQAERTLYGVEVRANRPAEAADALARMPPEAVAERGVHFLVEVALERSSAGDHDRAAALFGVVLGAVANTRFLQFPEAFYRGMLGEALARAGRDEDARQELELAARDYEALLGPAHPGLAPVLVALAEVLERLGDGGGAREACQRVFALCASPERVTGGPYRESAAPSDPLEHERGRAREVFERVRRC